MNVARREPVVEEQRVVVALDHEQLVALGVFARDVPRRLGPVRDAADREPVALAERVVGEAVVLPRSRPASSRSGPGYGGT